MVLAGGGVGRGASNLSMSMCSVPQGLREWQGKQPCYDVTEGLVHAPSALAISQWQCFASFLSQFLVVLWELHRQASLDRLRFLGGLWKFPSLPSAPSGWSACALASADAPRSMAACGILKLGQQPGQCWRACLHRAGSRQTCCGASGWFMGGSPLGLVRSRRLIGVALPVDINCILLKSRTRQEGVLIATCAGNGVELSACWGCLRRGCGPRI